MEIIWHGHSCFELVSGGYSLVLDPYYHRELCVYPELRLTADAVLCSHGHYGHGWTEAVELRRGGAPDPFALVICVLATLAGARGSALFANRADPKTLNRFTGVVLTVLGAAMVIVRYLF